MGIISGKKITDALAKAKDVGVVEEPLTLGELSIVLRNLRPDQYTAIYEENKEREGIDSLFNFQKSHVCRSIVEINGIDLRDVTLVEVDEPIKDPKTQEYVIDPATNEPKTKKVRLERHDYIRQYVLDGLTKEPLLTVWRKFNDVLKLSEDKAKDGVKFVLPEMTPEERLREALGQVREVIDEVPAAMAEQALEEAGLMRISTADEIKRAMEATDRLAREQEAAAQQAQAEQAPPPPQAPPQQAPPQHQQVPLTGAPPTGPRVRQPTPEELMARRTPMNRDNVQIPSPTIQPAIASPNAAPPPGPPQPPPQVSGEAVIAAAQRTSQIARLEAESLDLEVPVPPPGDPTMQLRHVPPAQQGPTTEHAPNAPHLRTGVPPEVAVLQKGRDRVDMKAFDATLNKPPAAGINPKYRPHR